MVSSLTPLPAPFVGERGSIRRLRFAGDERALIEGVAAGQAAAAAELYDRYVGEIRRILLRLVGPSGDLDDLVRAAYVAIYESIGRVPEPGALRAWMIRAAIDTARKHLSAKRMRRWLRVDDGELPAPAEGWRLLERMGVEDRIVFSLRFIEGMELGEMAMELDLPVSTLERRVARASARFQAARPAPKSAGGVARRRLTTDSGLDSAQIGAALAQDLERHEAIVQAQETVVRQRVLMRYLGRKAYRKWPRAALVGLAGAAAVALGFLWLRAGGDADRFVEPRAWTALPQENYLLAFSDGSTLEVTERYGARVLKTAKGGAEVALEHGRLEVHVVQRPDVQWKVLAGPFTILFGGARFTADWQPDTGRFAVDVREGVVLVQRAGGGSHSLHVGERIELAVLGSAEGAIDLGASFLGP